MQAEAMKYSHWEQAKGHLRAMVAVHGCRRGQVEDSMKEYENLRNEIEEFIEHIEAEGLCE